ncbi:hypothetical protein [Desulfolutivibrio sulfoxidireducens]|uniref:hypothetical protein n=1 Tax=Desulfolutivibrio sulfoxidireducens TaxID=2773299 RepID=UPI00159DD4B1|nr:hypothetical protein [Desulfolutivibrio sulfoxidireducens]QLA17877.1 hypothetical protein GD605_18210 [Desulfolutivibrio sulfoxidireducens]QLA21457.1 hypothetical protein GD604_17840 [Desulfolutivibrio sulfoxidireducens]
MSEGLQLELKKPLEKMTAKELRELSIKQLPQVVGVSGMGKDELLAEIKKVLGIGGEEGPAVSPYKGQILAMKRQAKVLRAKKAEAGQEMPRKERVLLRRKINKLKKRSRRLAAAS